MATKIVMIRLEDETVAKLKAMAKVDKKDMEVRLSEIIEELVRRAQ